MDDIELGPQHRLLIGVGEPAADQAGHQDGVGGFRHVLASM